MTGSQSESDFNEWSRLAEEMTPASSIRNIGESAKFVVTTVAIVGSLVTGFGLLGAPELIRTSPTAAILLTVSIGLSFTGLIIALAFLRLRVTRINPSNLVEVRNWFDSQVRWSRALTVAGLCILASVVSAGAAVAASLWTVTDPAFSGVLTATPTSKAGPPVRKGADPNDERRETTWRVEGTVACSVCKPGEVYVVTMVRNRGLANHQSMVGVARSDRLGNFSMPIQVGAAKQRELVTVYIDGTEVVSIMTD